MSGFTNHDDPSEIAKELGNKATIVEITNGDLDSAKMLHEQAYELDRSSTVRLINFATLMEVRGELDRAKSLYEEAIALDPNNVKNLTEYGDLLQELNLPLDAEIVYKKCLQLEDGPVVFTARVNLLQIHTYRAKETEILGELLETHKSVKLAMSKYKIEDARNRNNATISLANVEEFIEYVSMKPYTSCKICGKVAPNVCSKCKIAKYCSQKCQSAHWPFHKTMCGWILIKDLQLGTTHKGKYIKGVVVCEPYRINAVYVELQDKAGGRVRVAVYNYPGYKGPFVQSTTKPDMTTQVFSKGQKLLIKDPFYKIAMDGGPMVRVDVFSNITILT